MALSTLGSRSTALLDRRTLLRNTAAVSLGALLPAIAGVGRAFAADPKSVETLFIPTLLEGPLRGMIEQQANVKVNNGAYTSTFDVLTKLMSPGGARFDLACGATDVIKFAILGDQSGRERTQPINAQQVPNSRYISNLGRPDVLERDGKTYAVPVIWGYESVVYNRDHVREDDELTQSWGLLYSDKYAGRIAWMDAPYYTLFTAGLYMGHPDPHKADRKELEEITRFVISKKKNVRAMWQTAAQAINLMASGEVVAMYGQIAARVALQRRGLNVTNNWPKEGLATWTLAFFVPKTAASSEGGFAVLNALLSGEVGAAITRQLGYPSCSTLADGILSAEEKKAAGYDVVNRGYKLKPYNTPPVLTPWIEAWSRVKSA